MKATIMQTAFNGGELSPYLAGRVDVAKYPAGCKRMEGFIPLVQGPAITRPGTWYVAEVKNSANRTWLLRFEFSESDCYMLEFGHLYVRFFYNRAQVVSGGAAYEIASPYTSAELTNSDGTFALRYVQTGDVVYLVHPNHPPYKLSRFAATNWTLAAVDFDPPPFKATNTSSTTITASAISGSVTLTASSSLFSSANVGQRVFLEEADVRSVMQWEPGKSVTAGQLRRSDGKNYKALNSATTGSVTPTHTEGAAYDGDGGVQWLYMDAGYGWAKITAVASGTSATATVESQLPSGASTTATTRWAFEAWNATDGYPDVVTFFRERLVFARDDTLWFSVSADFEDFAYQINGAVTADAGFDRTIASDGVNSIRWMSPGDVLLVGTLGDEWAITEATTTDPFGPSNAKAKRQSKYGSNRVTPVRVGNDTVFVQKAGKRVRAMQFQFTEDGFASDDLTKFAGHIQKPGIVDMAYQQEPWGVVWCARSDGVLVGLSFDRQHEVVAWHRQPFEGGVVETVEVIPSPDGSRDDLWMIVRYTINGATKRYIAYLGVEDDETGTVAQSDWCYADMMLSYSGAPATTISGLNHLEGQTVWVLTDGARHPNRVVTGGQITLQVAASKVQVGLPSPGRLETMNLEGGSGNGTAQGKAKRINVVTVRVNRSLGWTAGADDDHLQEGQFRSASVPMGSAPPPYTGDVDVEWDADYDSMASVVIAKDRPMPASVIAVIPQLMVSEGR